MRSIEMISSAVALFGWSVGTEGPWYYASHPRIKDRETGRAMRIRRLRPESLAEEIRIKSRSILDPRACEQIASALGLDHSPVLAHA